MEACSRLQGTEEFHHAVIAWYNLEHRLAADHPPAGTVMYMCPVDPDSILVPVQGSKSPDDSRRLLKLHLPNYFIEEAGRRGCFLNEDRSREQERYEE